MKVLLLIAHGSRQVLANDEIGRLARQVLQRGGCEFEAVQAAFLEIAEPDIHQGIDRCVEMGADSITVVPYFLAAGNHVRRDIPAEIACARIKYPHLSIELTDYVGASDEMAGLVLRCAGSPARP